MAVGHPALKSVQNLRHKLQIQTPSSGNRKESTARGPTHVDTMHAMPSSAACVEGDVYVRGRERPSSSSFPCTSCRSGLRRAVTPPRLETENPGVPTCVMLT